MYSATGNGTADRRIDRRETLFGETEDKYKIRSVIIGLNTSLLLVIFCSHMFKSNILSSNIILIKSIMLIILIMPIKKLPKVSTSTATLNLFSDIKKI